MYKSFLKLTILLTLIYSFSLRSSDAKIRTIKDLVARPPIHIKSLQKTPGGLTPSQIKSIYNLPKTGGSGTIAIIDAFDSPSVESDLKTFDKQFNLPDCTKKNKCLKVHKMSSNVPANEGWGQETALDVEWTHAIAPNAKILLIEASSSSGIDLLKAVDYARGQKDVVSISMSWGGLEFPNSNKYDSYFTSKYGATFFASSGDNGTGVQWPAVSPNVIGVGGTTVKISQTGKLVSETAWSGSGGGVSQYILEPNYQTAFHISKNNGKRAVPDVSYNADPNSGFSIYHNGWAIVGGTSAGAPQWAAMRALGKNISSLKLYNDAAGSDYRSYFRDIIKGTNGDCGILCKARKSYDTVTGLGSPLTTIY